VHPLEYHRSNLSGNSSVLRLRDYNILRSYNNINERSLRHIIHALELSATKSYLHITCHDSLENVTLADKVRNKCILRLIIYILRCTYLLYSSLRHYNNLIRHRKCLFLVMRYIYKCNSELVMHILKLKLHLLTHLKVKCSKRLIKHKNLRLIDKRPCNRNPLLLSAGKC